MKKFNISEWGLRNQILVLYAMVVLTAIGLLAYSKLGQSEDPPFTFKVMVIRVVWPGATAQEVAEQVADKIEKKVQEIAQIDTVRSTVQPGFANIFFIAKDSTPAKDVPDIWYQVRKKVGDIKANLPQGVQGPYFNDEFGDTFGNIFALEGNGMEYAELKRYAEAIRSELLRVKDVSKIDFFGNQIQRVFIELSNTKLATFGLTPATVAQAISSQNIMSDAGFFETQNERIALRITGRFETLDDIRESPIFFAGRSLRLGDIAEVRAGYQDPPADTMRYMGKPVLGIGVAMRAGGDIIALGKNLDAAIRKIESQLPAGITLYRVADQPRAVHESVNEFVRSLAEAVIIVLAVSLLSLGLRTGIVVAISIPVVLAITFLMMDAFGIGLHKISLGALILALGLLVDDAIIAVEMMATKMEEGWDRTKAGSFAYTSTAMPMLSGTLVTAAGFLPIAMAASSTGEYTRSIFQVTVIALLISWVAAVLFVPYLGYHLLPDFTAQRGKPSLLVRFAGRVSPRLSAWFAKHEHKHEHHDHAALYNTPFYKRLRGVIDACVKHRWKVIGATLLCFVASIVGFSKVPQQFFPDSTRPELLVDLRLPEGVSHLATDDVVKQVEAILLKETGIENFVAYSGAGSPRFYLPLDQQLPATRFAQFVVLTKGSPEREALRTRLIDRFSKDFPQIYASVLRLENGPPVGFPVQYRIIGPEASVLRPFAHKIAALMRQHPALANVQLDWDAPSKVVRLNIDQSKARAAGLSNESISNVVNAALNGQNLSEMRMGIETIPITFRAAENERAHLQLLADLAIPINGGRSVPLAQVASLEYGFEDQLIMRRDRTPVITVRANLYGTTQPAQVVADQTAALDAIRAELPLGYRIDVGGAVEESAKGGESVAAGVPVFLLVVLTVLMLQLQNVSRVVMVLLTAPLGLIGVTVFLLLFGKPFGFVAMLGTIALSGMIMRNSVILVDQIKQDREEGIPIWEAIVGSTVRRFRPIMLTAAAAILAMIPLSRSAFFGPMAVAIMGGLLVATLLTLFFLPALYAAWYKVKPTTVPQ